MGNACTHLTDLPGEDVIPSAIVPPDGGDPQNKNYKVLVLGTAESGKSTICRHIRQLHGEQFNDQEIKHFKQNIRASCFEHFINITSDFLKNEILEPSHQQQCAKFLEKYKNKSEIDREFLEAAVTIWSISSLQKYILDITTLHNSTKSVNVVRRFETNGSGTPISKVPKRLHSDNPASHFLRSFDRIMAKGYSPKLEDILSLRVPTSGLVETSFTRGDLLISLIDVGGQRSERKKWLHCFDSVDAVLFVVAMSEYDEVLAEDSDVNRMQESLKLFSTMCNIKWFLKASFLLFLNKKDVFDEKIVYSPLSQCFVEYTGADNKYEASNYIWQKFADQNHCNRGLYFHFTKAKDSQNIHVVFDVVVDTIIRSNLRNLGFQ